MNIFGTVIQDLCQSQILFYMQDKKETHLLSK